MRKTFSFLMTLVLMGFATVANAGTKVVYSWESPNGTVAETGGTAKAYVDEARVNYKNKFHEADSAYTICLSGKTDFSTTAYVEIVLSEALAEGDQFVVTAYRNKGDNTKLASMAVKFGENATLWKPQSTGSEFNDVAIDNANPNTVTFTVPAEAIGTTTFKMSRDKANTNLFITKLEIVRATDEVLTNGTFDVAADAVSVGICTYEKDKGTNSTNFAQQVPVTGWTIPANGDARAGGVFQYGSGAWLGGVGDANKVPATDKDGKAEGYCLGMLGVWTGVVKYTQEVTLPAGDYKFTCDVMNTAGTTAFVANYFGVSWEGGSAYDTNMAYAVGTWTPVAVSFTLEAETVVTVSVGYAGANTGSGGSQHLFVDNVKISEVGEAEQIAAAKAELQAVIDEAKGYEAAALADAISAAEAAIATPTLAGIAAAKEALEAAIYSYKMASLKSDWMGDEPAAGAFYIYNVAKGQWANKVTVQWGTEFGTTDTRDLTITLSDVEGLWKFVASSNTNRQIGLDGSEMYVDINNQGNSFYTFVPVETSVAGQHFYAIAIDFKDGTKTGYLYAAPGESRIRVQATIDENAVFQLVSTTSPELAAAELKEAIAALEAVIEEAEGYAQESLAAAIADAKAAVAAPTAEGLSAAQAALEAAIAAYKSTLLTSPWTGSVPETGTTYYIYNVASGKFLIGSNDWSTQASLLPYGSPFIADVSEDGVTLSGVASNGGTNHYLGNNMYVDSSPYKHKIQPVEGHPTWFTIEYYQNDQTKFASYDGSSVVAGATSITENSYWQFVTREEFCSAAATAEHPFDMTSMVNDPSFSRNVYADTQSNSNKTLFWNGTPAKGGPNTNFCAEVFNKKVDVYQTIEGLPAGWYEVTAQGFYRHGQTADAATDTVPVTFYANGASTPFKSILDTELATVPNDLSTASSAFAGGEYCLDTLKVAVGADGKLTIGFKKDEEVDQDWTCFDNVRLYYVEPLAESDQHASGVIADMKPGKYYIYFTDAEGKDHFLNAAAANNWVASADPVTVELSAGNVTDAAAYGRFASFIASNGFYMSNAQNSDGSGYIKTETISGSNGQKKRTWESQVFYQLGDKYAIRLTNNTGTSWGANCFANVDSLSFKVSSGNPSLGDALYVWSIADENDPKFSTGALVALIEKSEALGDAMNGAVKATLDSLVAVAKAATVADVATVKPALEAAYAAAVASVAEYESLAKAIATANTIYVDIAGGAASFKEAIDAAQAAYDGRTADASTITAMSAASDSYLKLNELNGYLVNGDFEAATTKEGWVDEVETISTGNHNKWNHVNNHFVEKWVSSGALADFEFNQTIKGLPAGTYAIGSYINACLQSDVTRVVKGVSFYANSDSVAVHGFNIDGTDAQKAQGPDYYFVITTIAEGDSIKFGISVKGTDANWVVADNFKLYSFNEATAVLAFIDEAKALIAANPAVGGVVLADLQAQIDHNTGIEAVVAAMDAFKAAIPSYTKLATLEAEYDAVEAMADANAAAKAALTDVAGTYEGVDAAYDVYVEAVFQYRFAVATVDYSCDMTDRYVVNADMSSYTDKYVDGWDTYAAYNGWGHDRWQYQGNTNTNGSITISKYVECWGKSTNIGASYAKQSVDSIPNGLYRFSADLVATVQNGGAGKAAVKEAYIFANGDSVAVATADGAPEHFEVYTLVTDGAVTFGFCSTDSSVVDWIGFDNAKLEYCGTSAQIIGISVDASSLTLGEGESAQLTAEVSAVGEIDKTVTWTSSNESVATVDNTGKVTAILASDEVVTITAKAGSFTATTAVKVGVTAHTYEFRQWTEEQLAAMEAAKASKYFTKLTDYYKSGDALESAVLAPDDSTVVIPDLKWTVGKGNLRLYFGETIAANYIYFNAAGSVTVPNPYKGMTVTANINGVDSVIVKATTEKEITIELAKKDQLYWIQVDEAWVPTYKEFTEDVVFMTTTDNMAAAYAEGWAANEDAGSNFQMNAKKKYTIDPATDETVDATKCDGFIIKNNAPKMVHFYVKNVKEVVVYAVNSSSDDARDLKVSAEGQTASATAEGGATVKASVATTQGAEVDVKIEASGDMVVYAVKFIYGADSIEEALIDMANGEFYDLTGRKVAEPVSGSIYIVNGKKVLMK